MSLDIVPQMVWVFESTFRRQCFHAENDEFLDVSWHTLNIEVEGHKNSMKFQVEKYVLICK